MGNSRLQPTQIVDKNGVQTTRNMRAFEKPKQNRKIPVTPSLPVDHSSVTLTEKPSTDIVNVMDYAKKNPDKIIFLDESSHSTNQLRTNES